MRTYVSHAAGKEAETNKGLIFNAVSNTLKKCKPHEGIVDFSRTITYGRGTNIAAFFLSIHLIGY